MVKFFKSKKDKEREAIMEAVRRATAQGQCVILADTPKGTRVIVLGGDTMTHQLKEIAEQNQVEI